MICVKTIGDRCHVVAICEVCLFPILEAAPGIYLWRRDLEPLVHVHKGECDQHWCASNGSEWAWHELDDLPVYLGSNLGREWPDEVMQSVPQC